MKTRFQSTHLENYQNPRKSLPYDFKMALFLGVNALLGLLMSRFPTISTLHVYLTMLVGMWILLTTKSPYPIIYWMGYVVGSELVWRGMGANTFWETGKYAIIVFSVFSMLKYKNKYRPNFNLIPYFLLLAPSVMLLPAFDREAIAFDLAGPFALMTASLFFSQVGIDRNQLKNLLLMILASVLIFSVLVLVGVITADTIEFGSGSVFETSANTGPNQASSILSLGAFAAILYVVLEKEHKFLQIIVLMIALGLITQMLLTFSRGGVWTLVGALIVAGLFFLGDKRYRTAFAITSIFLILALNFYIMPALNRYTSGALGARISSIEATGRVDIVRSDLEVFLENPLFGVGPGRSNPYHARYFRVSSAHTEFSRMLAEHGTFGAISLLVLLISLAKIVIQNKVSINRAVVASCFAWGLLFMAHSATRLVAPSFLIGLAFAHFILAIEADYNNSQTS